MDDSFRVTAVALGSSEPERPAALGYALQEASRSGALSADRAAAAGLNGAARSRLKAGEAVTTREGLEVRPEHVVAPSKPGRLLVIAPGGADPSPLAGLAAGADVVVCDASAPPEAAPAGRQAHAAAVAAAAGFARAVGARRLLLTGVEVEQSGGPASGGADEAASSSGEEADPAVAAAAKMEEAYLLAAAAAEYPGPATLARDFYTHVLEKHEGVALPPEDGPSPAAAAAAAAAARSPPEQQRSQQQQQQQQRRGPPDARRRPDAQRRW
jgi:ribonuclease BN (tRNA processing enzyme)